MHFKSTERKRGSKTEFTLLKNQVECDNFRNVHKIDPRVYPDLSKVEKIGLEKESCWLMIPYGSRHHSSCIMCLEKFLFYQVEARSESTSRPASFLWWRRGELNRWSWITDVLNKWQGKVKCGTIKQLPKMICSEHEQYSRKSYRNEKDIVVFYLSTSGLWPPTRATLYGRDSFDKRVTIMVELEAIESEGCVSCMMLRTEVFFM